MTLTKIDDRGLKTPIDLLDNEKIRLGTGNDLEIFHNGTHSFIQDTGTGNLEISSSKVAINNAANSANMATFTDGGAVALYHNGSKKLETTSDGATVSGDLTIDGSTPELRMKVTDDSQSHRINFYNTADSIVSRIFAEPSGNISIRNGTNAAEECIKCLQNGAVELYYDNVKKLNTEAGGITVAGTIWTDAVQLNDNEKYYAGTSQDLRIYHDGTDSIISNHNEDLYIDCQSDDLILKAADNIFIQPDAGDNGISINGNGAVELYHDNDLHFATTADGVKTNGDLSFRGDGDAEQILFDASDASLKFADDKKAKFGTGDDLQIYHDSSNTKNRIDNYGVNFHVVNKNADGAVYEEMIIAKPNEEVALYYNGNKRFETNYNATTMYGGGEHRCSGHFRPYNNDTWDIGTSGDKWDDVYATNGTIQTSDRNEKNTIVDTDLGLTFINKLKPVSYRFNNKTRTHYGLIAQDVETTLSDISKPTSGFAGFIKEDIPDKLYEEDDDIPEGKKVGDVKTAAFTTYGLRYNEFISPLIKAVQELSAEVETLKTKVAALEAA